MFTIDARNIFRVISVLIRSDHTFFSPFSPLTINIRSILFHRGPTKSVKMLPRCNHATLNPLRYNFHIRSTRFSIFRFYRSVSLATETIPSTFSSLFFTPQFCFETCNKIPWHRCEIIVSPSSFLCLKLTAKSEKS